MGERAVRDALNSGKYGEPSHKNHSYVSAWLADVAFVREAENSAKRDAREEETLSIAKSALSIAKEQAASASLAASSAREQARWAKWAAIIATVAAIIAMVAASK